MPTTDDTEAEEDETFTVGLSVSGTSHTVTATATATGTILDDDAEVGAASQKGTTTLWLDKSFIEEDGGARRWS